MIFLFSRIGSRIQRTYASLRCRALGCELGERVVLNGLPRIFLEKGGRIILKDRVTINSSRESNTLNVSGATTLHVGRGAELVLDEGAGVSGSQIIAKKSIYIGRNSAIGAGSLLCDSDMHEVPLHSDNIVRKSPIRIGQGVFVGARCVILKGVIIGDGAVVGAGSVVTNDVPANSLVAGNPARIIRAL